MIGHLGVSTRIVTGRKARSHAHSGVPEVVTRLFTTVYTQPVGRAGEDGYDGVPYEDLEFDEIAWSDEVAQHMASRSQRYGRIEFDIPVPRWATEAAQDPRRLVGDGRSRDGASVRVVGWSPSARAGDGGGAGRLLKVWLVGDGPATTGRWIGRTACEANESDARDYWAGDGEQEGRE